MQSLHYNNGSIKLTRERSTMVSRWETAEVARWIRGLAGINSDTSDIFLKNRIDGTTLSLLLREDLIRMGITQLDQQLILMQSIDTLLTLVNRLNSETLALLFMRIHCTATTCYNLLKRPEDKDSTIENSNVINSPEFYTSISHLSDTIVLACHWLGRLPFIENTEYIDLRRRIINVLIQIRLLIRSLKRTDQFNITKSKLIVDINNLRTTAMMLVRQNKDSLVSSDCYLTRVHLRRPLKDDVNIEYTTMPDFTHVISSIETESMSFMGAGFSAINIGDEIIEINNQVVIGWDPIHFNDLLRTSSQSNEICLLVKKMPRHNDDEVYTKRLADGPQNPRRSRARGALERRNQQTQENRTMLLEQIEKIEIESDDETLYQSKRASQIKREQHSSLPDLSESITNSTSTFDSNEHSDQIQPSSSSSSTIAIVSPKSFVEITKAKSIERPQSAGANLSSPNSTPKSPKKTVIESYFTTFFRPRQDAKSVIADMNDSTTKDQPQLVNIKRIHSIKKQASTMSLHDEHISTSPPTNPLPTRNQSGSQTSLQTNSLTRSSLSNIFKTSDATEKGRTKRANTDAEKAPVFRTDFKHETMSISSTMTTSSIVTNKPPLFHSDSRKSSASTERRYRPKRTPSYRNISCKDLGKGDCEGFLYRYSSKGTISFVQWKLYWCVLKGGVLYVFKSQDDKNQEIEIKLEGKNVSPAPEKRKYGFRIADENSKNREYFSCTSRDEMAKWMNKMGLAAINFNIDDSKIGGFNKAFLDSTEVSPITTPTISKTSSSSSKINRSIPMSSVGDSGNDSDKESCVSWQKSVSHHSSVSDVDSSKEKFQMKSTNLSDTPRHTRSSSSASLLSLPETQITVVKSNCVSHVATPTTKGHHRTCSTPIRFSPAYEDEQENVYVQTAPRLSDSDSLNDLTIQRTFVNSTILNENPTQESLGFRLNVSPLMLNSSGGFTTPTGNSSSASGEKTPSFSPPLRSSSSERPSSNSVFLLADDDQTSRSECSSSDKRNFSFDDPFSPGFSQEHFPLPSPPSRSSSSSIQQQHSPATVRTAPLYISVYSTSPSVPLVKSTHSSSTATVTTTNDDDETFFARRSPSPPSSRKVEQSTNRTTPSVMQQMPFVAFHRYHHSSTSKEQQK